MSLVGGSKPEAALASALLLGAVLLPVRENWRDRPNDAFPLSYFPMFSAQRGSTGKVTHLVGLDAAGGRQALPYTLAGSGGLNQVRRQLRRAARRGSADQLCRAVAARIAGKRGYAEVVEVQVVTGEYRYGDYFAGRKEPLRERVHVTWPVPRGAAA